MNNQNRPDTITIEDQNFGSHVEHWNLLTDNPATEVPKWLGLALDAPVMPMGLCLDESDMDASTWLIQGPNQSPVQFAQVIEVENNKPKILFLLILLGFCLLYSIVNISSFAYSMFSTPLFYLYVKTHRICLIYAIFYHNYYTFFNIIA